MEYDKATMGEIKTSFILANKITSFKFPFDTVSENLTFFVTIGVKDNKITSIYYTERKIGLFQFNINGF